MNYGKGLKALRKKDQSVLQMARNKGILLNIDDFEGDIQLLQNDITQNMVFIPTAIVSNADKYNKSAVGGEDMQSFESEGFEGSKSSIPWSEPVAFLEMTKYSDTLNHYKQYLNYMDPQSD